MAGNVTRSMRLAAMTTRLAFTGKPFALRRTSVTSNAPVFPASRHRRMGSVTMPFR